MAIVAHAFEHLNSGGERPPPIVPTVILHVFKKQNLGLVELGNAQDMIKECASSVLEAQLLP